MITTKPSTSGLKPLDHAPSFYHPFFSSFVMIKLFSGSIVYQWFPRRNWSTLSSYYKAIDSVKPITGNSRRAWRPGPSEKHRHMCSETMRIITLTSSSFLLVCLLLPQDFPIYLSQRNHHKGSKGLGPLCSNSATFIDARTLYLYHLQFFISILIVGFWQASRAQDLQKRAVSILLFLASVHSVRIPSMAESTVSLP